MLLRDLHAYERLSSNSTLIRRALIDMGKLNWPTLSRERPKGVFEHASALEHDFKALHEHVKRLKANKRHLAKLPSEFRSKISKGISLGLIEAIDNEYYPNFISDIDRDLFCKTLLQAIQSELATEAHDRIPLLEFDTLHGSYKELVKKLTSYLALNSLKRDMTPDSELEQTQGHCSQLPTSDAIHQAAIPGFEIEEDGVDSEIDEDAQDILRTCRAIEDQGTIVSHQLESVKGYTEVPEVPDFAGGHGRTAMGNDEERPKVAQAEEREERRDAVVSGEDGLESMQGEESEEEKEIDDSAIVGYRACKANAVDQFSDLPDDIRGADAMRGFERGERPRKTKKKSAHPRKENPRTTQNATTVNDDFASAFSKLVTFEIKHQATVNRLVLATSQEILDHLYQSLQEVVATRENLTDLIHLSEPRLVEDGNVMFRADTDLQDLFNPASMKAWNAEFEADLSPSVPTFEIALIQIAINSMNIATRQSKADVIHKLIGLNKHRFPSLHGQFDIIDLSWAPHSAKKQSTSLLIEFSNRQLANEVLQQGIAWQGEIHPCCMTRDGFRLTRCSRCQAYGHPVVQCSAPYRCGICAETHPTKDCTSHNQQCAACGGQHRAKNVNCPVRIAERKKIRFHTPESTAEIRDVGPITLGSDVENVGAVEGRTLPSSTSGLTMSPENIVIDNDELRLARCGKCQGYGHVASKCPARLRCGKCALHHFTWKCSSKFTRCALCNDDHMASSAICPARPLKTGSAQQLQKPEMPHMPPLRTSPPDPYPRESEIKIEPRSPLIGAAVRPIRTSKKRSMLVQVEELIQVVNKGNSREMALIKDHLETLELAMKAEGGDILAATPRAGKRRAQEALMSGALQESLGSPKRVKVEEFLDSTVYNSQS